MDYPDVPPVFQIIHAPEGMDKVQLTADVTSFLSLSGSSEVHEEYVVNVVNVVNLVRQFEQLTQQTTTSTLEDHILDTIIARHVDYTCSKCRRLLFSSPLVDDHSQDEESSACTSIFLHEPADWMTDISDLEGKLACPKCSSKVGSFCWAGAQCSCGRWVVPAFKVLKAKVDPKYS